LKTSLLQKIRCPICHNNLSVAAITSEDNTEIRTGTLLCPSKHQYEIHGGIIDFLIQPNEVLAKEINGLNKFAKTMKENGFTENDLLMIYEEGTGAYWDAIRLNFTQAINQVSFKPNETLLDIGANNCWASDLFSAKGLSVTALDISGAMFQGLSSGDVFIKNNGRFFERVLSSMTDLPFIDQSFNYVFCSAVLHHNKPNQLQQTLGEIFRILKHDGNIIIINEPVRGIIDKKSSFGNEVEEYEGNENIYSFYEYQKLIKHAGFKSIHLLPPDSFYTMISGDIRRTYPRNNILRIGFNSFAWLYNKGFQNILKKLSYKPIEYLVGGLPLVAIVGK